MFACEILYIKKGTLYHAIGHTDPRVQHCQAELLVKTLPSSLPFSPFHLSLRTALRSIIVEHRSRRARYKCPSLSGTRNPQQFPSCLAILPRRLFFLPHPFLPPSLLSCSFLSFVPVQNLIPSSLKGLISPLLLVLFPRHPLKRARTVPGGSDGRSRGG